MLCLEFGAKIDSRTEDESTCVHLAAALGHHKIVEAITEKTPREDLVTSLAAQDIQGLTPLHRWPLFSVECDWQNLTR